MSVRNRVELSREELMEFLSYAPDTGEFRWLKRPSNRTKVGALAGSINGSGYREIELRGKSYQCNRLAVLFMNGHWPVDEVDHKNRIRNDDRWKNLREATKNQNQHNRGHQKGSSQYKGVYFHKLSGKWGACIQVNGEKSHLGLFEREDDAAQVRILTAIELHGEFARAG